MAKALPLAIVIAVLSAAALGFLASRGWNCGSSCEGFCVCYGLPLGDDGCLGVKEYECCVDCHSL
jgi:hypothetical protein